jgi:hypothetical protein
MPRFLYRFLPALLLVGSSAFGADSACKLLGEANAKIYGIPTHMYQTETAVYTGGKPRSNELIYFNNKTYILVGGKWSVSPMTPQKMAENQKEAQQNEAGMTCSVVRDEVVGGEATTLYSAHKQVPEVTTDTQIWISKSKGVPVKLEVDMNVGGTAGKSHRSIRYEYTNVQAPAGVQ